MLYATFALMLIAVRRGSCSAEIPLPPTTRGELTSIATDDACSKTCPGMGRFLMIARSPGPKTRDVSVTRATPGTI